MSNTDMQQKMRASRTNHCARALQLYVYINRLSICHLCANETFACLDISIRLSKFAARVSPTDGLPRGSSVGRTEK